MRQRTHYWSCSKFADWLRGTAKPVVGTAEAWDAWHKTAKSAHSVRYWIVEEGLDYIQGFLHWPLDKLNDVRYYVNNRWVSRTNSLTAHPKDIKPGQWSDVGSRFLPCLFNELVDFVEIEQAWHHCLWSDEAKTKFNVPWYRRGWLRWRTWRCPEAGLEYLRWAAGLKHDGEWVDKDDPDYGAPTPQAVAAQEIIALYDWWKNVYSARPDPYDVSGWTQYCEDRRAKIAENNDHDIMLFGRAKTPEEQEETSRMLDRCGEIEDQYTAEDTEMLIRLIKIRRSLWT
jgi:hypothetical protein